MGQRIKRFLFVCCVAFLIIFSILYLPSTQYYLTELLTVNADLRPAEAMVVLGGGLNFDGTLGTSTKERLNYAIHLFKLGFAEYLILSGADKAKGRTGAEVMHKQAAEKGVPSGVLIKEPYSSSTHENAVYTQKILSVYDLEGKVILVTSPYHMQRAVLCFKQQGIEVIPAPVEGSEIYTYGPYQSLRNIDLLLHEIFALAWYEYMGWI